MQRLWCAAPRPAWAFCAQIFDCEGQSSRRRSPELGQHIDTCIRPRLPVLAPVTMFVPVPVSMFVRVPLSMPVPTVVPMPMILRSSGIMFRRAWPRNISSVLNRAGDHRGTSLLYWRTGLKGLRPRGPVARRRECRSPQVTQRGLGRNWLLRMNGTA